MSISTDVWADLLRSKDAFLTTIVDNMTGWLDRYAAKRTLDLLEYQESNQINGSLYEVGVYYGKYFSLLARSAALTGASLVGIDLFEYLSPDQFHTYFDEKFTPSNLAKIAGLRWNVIATSSAEIGASKLLEYLTSEARFISLDGSHEYDDVLWDLRVAEQVLSPAGIIAADDIINPICLGVAAAIYRFLEVTPSVVPFAQVSNKLFLCRPAWANRYRSVIESAILAETNEIKSTEYQQSHKEGPRRNIEAAFRGYQILTIRL